MSRGRISVRNEYVARGGNKLGALGKFLGPHGRTPYGRFNLAADILVLIIVSAPDWFGTLCEFISSLNSKTPYKYDADGRFNLVVFCLLVAFCMFLCYKHEKNINKIKKMLESAGKDSP